jgi:hypothetical protein
LQIEGFYAIITINGYILVKNGIRRIAYEFGLIPLKIRKKWGHTPKSLDLLQVRKNNIGFQE